MTSRAVAVTCCVGLVAVGAAIAGCDGGGSRRTGSYDWLETAGQPTPAGNPQPAPEQPPNLLQSIFGGTGTSGGSEKGNYSILLHVFRSPTAHARRAKEFKANTEKHAGWKHLFIVHKADHSELYWGRYEAIDDARPNLRKAKAFKTPAGARIYTRAIIVVLPGQDVGPPEWSLPKAPERYAFTVLRAVFFDVAEANYVGRKRLAVEYCEQLRRQGVPAYYRHDSAQSIVTIGLFERSAVRQVKRGDKVEPVARDPRIQDIFKRFPELAVNGRQKLVPMVNAKTGKVERVPAPTYLMAIPRESRSHGSLPRPSRAPRPGNAKPGQAPRDSAGPRAVGAAGRGAGRVGGG